MSYPTPSRMATAPSSKICTRRSATALEPSFGTDAAAGAGGAATVAVGVVVVVAVEVVVVVMAGSSVAGPGVSPVPATLGARPTGLHRSDRATARGPHGVFGAVTDAARTGSMPCSRAQAAAAVRLETPALA